MLLQQAAPPAGLGTWPVGRGFSQNLKTLPRGVYRQKAKSKHPAQLHRPPIPVPAFTCLPHRQPHFVGNAQAVDALQDEIEGKAHFQFCDRHMGRLTRADGHNVATTNLTLRGQPALFKKRLHGGVKTGFRAAFDSSWHAPS